MTPKQFKLYLDRDKHCYHCGSGDTTLIPQHRKGRGMGGSKTRDGHSNIIVFCSRANGLLESNAEFATFGRRYGWKLNSWDNTETTPVYDMATGIWWLLDNAGEREPATQKQIQDYLATI